MRVTIACPEAMIADANQLMRCIGQSAADDLTFSAADWADESGHRYAAASMIVPAEWQGTAMAVLSAPAWGCNVAAAIRAQSDIIFGATADPSRISAVIGDDPQAAIAVLGLRQTEA